VKLNQRTKIWIGWAGFAVAVGTFIGLEEYAVRTQNIKPFSDLMWHIQAHPKHPTKREASRYILMGAWLGFCTFSLRENIRYDI
jgi:hypothetical protein